MPIAGQSPDLKSHYLTLKGTRIHYFEQGEGDPVFFLHGVPTSAWIWRQVIPHMVPLSRCIAPDLAGFGQSGQPDHAYTLGDQLVFLDGLIEHLKLDHITFVLHGWGGIPGLTWAMQHEKRCKALVFYETWLQPVKDDFLSLPWQELIAEWTEEKKLKSVATHGLRFADQMLRQMAIDAFDENTLAHYCAPFSHTGAGKPLAAFLAEAPRGDGKSTADALLKTAGAALQKSQLPKLLMYSHPGFLTTMSAILWAREALPQLEVVEIGEGLHYAPELEPTRMGEMMSAWLQSVDQREKHQS